MLCYRSDKFCNSFHTTHTSHVSYINLSKVLMARSIKSSPANISNWTCNRTHVWAQVHVIKSFVLVPSCVLNLFSQAIIICLLYTFAYQITKPEGIGKFKSLEQMPIKFISRQGRITSVKANWSQFAAQFTVSDRNC